MIPAAMEDGVDPNQHERVAKSGKPVISSDDEKGGVTDDESEVTGAAAARRKTPGSCWCGDGLGFSVRHTRNDDMTGVVVISGGRFPCLHIGLVGLRPDVRYFVALDFVEVDSVDGSSSYEYTEPYFTPRPNNLSGMQWMGGVLCFNLNSIANGGLRDSGSTLKAGYEYEPTLRLLELRDDQWPSGSSAMRFPLRGTAFLVVSLSSEVRMNSTALASEILLVRRSEMSRGRFYGASTTRIRCGTQEPPQQEPNAEQQSSPQNWYFSRSSAAYRSSSFEAMTATLQSDRRWLLEQRVDITQASSLPVQQRGIFQQQSRIVLFDVPGDWANGGPSPAAYRRPAPPPICPEHAHALRDWWFRSAPPPMLRAPPLVRGDSGFLLPPAHLERVALARPSPTITEQAVVSGARDESTD